MTQQIIAIQQNMAGRRFAMSFLFCLTYWTCDCGFRWHENLGRASWLTVMQPQSVSGFLTSLFSCYAGEQEHPCPLLQATVWYVPAALRIQSLFSALRSVKQTNVLETLSTRCGIALLSLPPCMAPVTECFIRNYIFQTNKQTNKTNHPDCWQNHSLLVSVSNKTF